MGKITAKNPRTGQYEARDFIDVLLEKQSDRPYTTTRTESGFAVENESHLAQTYFSQPLGKFKFTIYDKRHWLYEDYDPDDYDVSEIWFDTELQALAGAQQAMECETFRLRYTTAQH